MKIEGKLHVKSDTQQVTDTFRKRDFVVEYADNPMYPQFIKFELIQDNVALVDNIEAGTLVEVDFNLRGREWVAPDGVKKYFNSLVAWKVQAAQSGGASAGVPDSVYDMAESAPSEGGDDLPF